MRLFLLSADISFVVLHTPVIANVEPVIQGSDVKYLYPENRIRPPEFQVKDRGTMNDQTLYYVVRLDKTWAIWEMTSETMAARAREDKTLEDRLDLRPFKTRTDAEKRLDKLNSSRP